jgi:hypothetical protein
MIAKAINLDEMFCRLRALLGWPWNGCTSGCALRPQQR